jgi:uncharacterized protein YjbJ (UPF0337 family)
MFKPKEGSQTMVNEDIIMGRWNQIKGEVKERWGRLTDDDITKVEGQRDKLLGILQEKYGYSKEEAEKSVDEFIRSYSLRT